MSLKLHGCEHRREVNMVPRNLHIEAPALGHELENLAELQRVLIVVYLYTESIVSGTGAEGGLRNAQAADQSR